MLFLIRTAFWLLVLILLLPTDAEQQSQIYGTAQSAVNDVATFCDRNPQTCERGKEAFGVLVQKAKFGAEMLMGFVERQRGATPPSETMPMPPEPAPNDESVMPVPPAAAPYEPTGWEMEASQDTLSTEDRKAAWGGPDASGV